MATFRLNPCFNGRYSQSNVTVNEVDVLPGLNPCFNGRYSQSDQIAPGCTYEQVS